MNLQEYYDAMRQAALRHFTRGEAQLDPRLHNPHDDRRGLTLRAKLPAPLAETAEEMLADFRRIEPEQYFYPATDLHLTILSLISCYRGFTLQTVDSATYLKAVRSSLLLSRPFTVTYSGVTASAGTVILQGTPADEGLAQLREQISTYFQQTTLLQAVDERYQVQTAHSTAIRFRSPLRNPARLIEMIETYQHHFLGSFRVEAIELVYNDWYHRASNTVVLETFLLGSDALGEGEIK